MHTDKKVEGINADDPSAHPSFFCPQSFCRRFHPSAIHRPSVSTAEFAEKRAVSAFLRVLCGSSLIRVIRAICGCPFLWPAFVFSWLLRVRQIPVGTVVTAKADYASVPIEELTNYFPVGRKRCVHAQSPVKT
jgi:hypothetical protein